MWKQGLAKAAFFTDQLKVTEEETKEKQPRWPLIEKWVNEQKLTYLELLVAHQWLSPDEEASEALALFVCYLTVATKAGHLCVHLKDNTLQPSLRSIWDERGELSEAEEKGLEAKIIEGAQKLDSRLCTRVTLEDSRDPSTPICAFNDSFYLQKNWIFETHFLDHLKAFIAQEPTFVVEKAAIRPLVAGLRQQGALLEEQAKAVELGCTNAFTIITGGPGTGKTYTAGMIIRLFWESLEPALRAKCRIAVAAPTGKAAAHLQSSLNRSVAALKDFPPIEAQTLHALLGMKSESSMAERRLPYDLLLIDETSMIDAKMMAALFKALKKGSRLILMGDKNQLPPVEAGCFFVDLIELHEKLCSLGAKPCFGVQELSVCVRAELAVLVDFARLIREGRSLEVVDMLHGSGKKAVLGRVLPENVKEAQTLLIEKLLRCYSTGVSPQMPGEELLAFFAQARLLSAMRQGPFGVDTLNELILEKMVQKQSGGWMAIPIIITANDYSQGLFNGETGVLMRRLPLKPFGRDDFALFPARLEGQPARRFLALLLPKYEPAYCLSVHKSQGSEFDKVLVVLPEGAEIFGRALFYTAVTRARSAVEVFSRDSIIFKVVAASSRRLSGVKERLSLI